MLGRCLFSVALLVGCSPAHSDAPAASGPRDADVPAPRPGEAVAYFAGGCFWGVEHFLEKLDGVAAVESGFMGGHVESPTYEQVSAETSGHYETVQVRYDPKQIGYEAIAKRFFEIHDPTQANGQGPDIGPEYRSVVFFANDEERRIAEGLMGRLRARGYDVVTELKPADKFWPAEEYHQNYYVKTGKMPYCHAPVDRFGD